jgi:polyribonucleotide nucleotidyltransferase
MTTPNNFAQFVAAHAPDDVLNGRVVSVVPFGSFVEMATEVHGLLYGTKLEEGAEVRVQILEIDQDRHRVSLKLA